MDIERMTEEEFDRQLFTLDREKSGQFVKNFYVALAKLPENKKEAVLNRVGLSLEPGADYDKLISENMVKIKQGLEDLYLSVQQ
jgi:hypothetical protein